MLPGLGWKKPDETVIVVPTIGTHTHTHPSLQWSLREHRPQWFIYTTSIFLGIFPSMNLFASFDDIWVSIRFDVAWGNETPHVLAWNMSWQSLDWGKSSLWVGVGSVDVGTSGGFGKGSKLQVRQLLCYFPVKQVKLPWPCEQFFLGHWGGVPYMRDKK